MNFKLKDKVVLITGCSRGIGLGIATEFASLGATLVLTEIKERFEELTKVKKQLEEKFQVDIEILCLDIKDIKDIRKKLGELKEPFNKIDILVNNAGINIIKDSLELLEDEWDQVLDVNLKGTFFMTQHVVKSMIVNNINGSIINIASQHGVIGNLNRAAYCSSKAGIINLTRALSYEWAKYGVRINCISPTYVETDNNREYLNSSKGKREYLNKIPIKKYAKPEHIAKACVFLRDTDSDLITGQNIRIDGGYTSI